MQNIAIIRQGTGRYLFSLPDNVTLKEGDRVKCSTKRGITDGVAFSDSAWVDENVSQLLGKLTGAKFPLKSVAGKMEYRSFDKPQDRPANKYEGMSNRELDSEMCLRGSCHVYYDGRRKHDCLFADGPCHDVTDSDRAEVIKYLLAEDAEADPKPEGKPTEDKQEPIKLYCVEDCHGSCGVSKGKIYDFDGGIEYDNANHQREYDSYEQWKRLNRPYSDVLFPLVARPAKVGEWVLLDCGDCFHKNKKGDIAKVVSAPFHTRDFCFIGDPTREYSGGICVNFESNYSYVLDGYHPEAEAEPEAEPETEYYNGKVVCVDNGGKRFFEVGKVYCFYDGVIFGANGFYSSRYETLEKANCGIGSKFIEFKGEAK